MEIIWVLAVLAVLIGAGALISRQRKAGFGDLPATHADSEHRTERARRRSTSGAYSGSWGFFGGGGGDGGGGFGGFDGGGCGGDGGGGSC